MLHEHPDIVCNIFVRYVYIEIKAFVLKKKNNIGVIETRLLQTAPHGSYKNSYYIMKLRTPTEIVTGLRSNNIHI